MISARPALCSRSGSVASVAVSDDCDGLMERADEILPTGMVDAGLAADGGVDLREQGRRDLDVGDSALIARRRKSGSVADDSAAQCNDRRVAPEAIGDEHIEQARYRRERFVRFAIR